MMVEAERRKLREIGIDPIVVDLTDCIHWPVKEVIEDLDRHNELAGVNELYQRLHARKCELEGLLWEIEARLKRGVRLETLARDMTLAQFTRLRLLYKNLPSSRNPKETVNKALIAKGLINQPPLATVLNGYDDPHAWTLTGRGAAFLEWSTPTVVKSPDETNGIFFRWQGCIFRIIAARGRYWSVRLHQWDEDSRHPWIEKFGDQIFARKDVTWEVLINGSFQEAVLGRNGRRVLRRGKPYPGRKICHRMEMFLRACDMAIESYWTLAMVNSERDG